ncbi:tRNA pseudouridine(55) synthase TruB [Silanimonas sp.]|uniref:tRNA pseudouridine(55) synthase TruB n=1 Tax=Silanimonas sp. TaxID=1929290 RepID=UPI0022CD125C|nr:tRNA pseudouridine(55) synthase TruB [Silanimonas sp.]MCZ8165353.1 tRNA pseudouridine(55) synthase TruB [Silanimonas sp.]
MHRLPFRSLDGLLLLDKPAGLSSNAALQRVRKHFRAEKAGHTGSLDPLATGLLPICFGEATKVAGLMLGARKAYETEARLGVVTDTDDADGQVLRERPVPLLDAHAVERVLKRYIGRISQRPPIYSALKQGGEPLYAKARRGEIVEVAEREVDVHALELLSINGASLRLRITCGSGTYVRSLVRDIGEDLGCGAHVVALRRLWAEPFRTPTMITLDEIEAIDRNSEPGLAALDSLLMPVESALTDWPRLNLSDAEVLKLGHGQSLAGLDAANGLMAAFAPSGRAVGLVEGRDGVVHPQRLFRWAAAS